MGRFISTTGTASPTLISVTSAHSTQSNERVLCDTGSTAFTVTLPAVANVMVGDQIQIIDIGNNFNSNNLTVGRNSQKIQGTAADLTISTNRAGISLVFYDSDNGWLLKYND